MNTQNWYRISLVLICLSMVLALAMNKAETSMASQAEAEFAAIDDYVSSQMDDLRIPGMALGIIEDGQIAHLQGYGAADATGREVTAQTPFHIGSVTKSFTALAVMQLVEEGKIELDAPVQQYLPWFTLADEEAAAKITVRNLLNHTSGISTYDGNRGFASDENLEMRVRGLQNIGLREPVGETFQYSNINYGIAGLIVETVSGQTYADYVSEHIFAPLEMRHSYASETPALADGLAAGHLYMFGQAVAAVDGVHHAHVVGVGGVEGGRGDPLVRDKGGARFEDAVDFCEVSARINYMFHNEYGCDHIKKIRSKLLAARNTRPRPELDDKVLTDWNGLMIAALARAAQVLDQPRYGEAAKRAARFILHNLRSQDGKLLHRWRNGQAGLAASAADYYSSPQKLRF